MYIYRVKQKVTAENITRYLKSKLGEDEDISSERSRLKCFMVGTNFRFKEDVYNPQIWPKGVAFRRFDFQKYRDSEKRTAEGSRPYNFL